MNNALTDFDHLHDGDTGTSREGAGGERSGYLIIGSWEE